MFEGVFIYAHVVLGFSVFGMFKHMCKRHDGKTRLYGQTCVRHAYTNISTDISKQGTNCTQLLLSVCSVAYAFSLWLVGRNSLLGDLTLTVWEPFVYIFSIILLLYLSQRIFGLKL